MKEQLNSGATSNSPFDAKSPLRRIGGEPALILGGPRALLLQVAHPTVAMGVMDHSDFREHAFVRLWRTMDAVMMILYLVLIVPG